MAVFTLRCSKTAATCCVARGASSETFVHEPTRCKLESALTPSSVCWQPSTGRHGCTCMPLQCVEDDAADAWRLPKTAPAALSKSKRLSKTRFAPRSQYGAIGRTLKSQRRTSCGASVSGANRCVLTRRTRIRSNHQSDHRRGARAIFPTAITFFGEASEDVLRCINSATTSCI